MHQLRSVSLPLVVLTGFLGSGKTTLLNRLLVHPSMRDVAVIVNEFGEIGIDHLLVSTVTDDIVLLASGCVCCTVGDDVGTALGSLLMKRRDGGLPPFRRVVLETTGIADPGPLLQRILSDAALAAQIRVDGIVTVVDAVFGGQTLGRHPECANQVAMANRLVVSKSDLTESAQVEELVEHLRSINPSAAILTPGHSDFEPDELLGGASADSGIAFRAIAPAAPRALQRGTAPVHGDRYATFCLCWDEPVDWTDFKAWLEGLLFARGDSILRMKGLLHVAKSTQPIVVQGVQHALYTPVQLPAWPQGTPRSEFVFVTRDFPREAALRSFRHFFPYRVTDARDPH